MHLRLIAWALVVIAILAPAHALAITSEEIFENLRPEVETEVYISGATLTAAVFNSVYLSCGPYYTNSPRAAEFDCSEGACPGQNVKGNSFAMGYRQAVSNHFYNVTNSGHAIGWHSTNFVACATPSSVAGTQCATLGARAWDLDMVAYGNTQLLSQQGIEFDCEDCLVTGDLIMKVSTDQAYGHTMVFLDWWDDDHLYYTVAEICETYGKAVYAAREVSLFNPSTGFKYWRHPELESPWALIDRSSFENGKVVFTTSRELHCDGFRLQGSMDGTTWEEASSMVPATGGGTYNIAPTITRPYYRIQSRETTTFNTRWLNHDEVLTAPAKPVTVVTEEDRGRPVLALVNTSGNPAHPGFADYLRRLGSEGSFDDAHLEVIGAEDADAIRKQGRTVKYWDPTLDHAWAAREDDHIKKAASPPVKKLLLMAPASLGLPLTDWRVEKEYEGWTVWIYTYTTGNWTSVINAANSIISTNGITHVQAFGTTRENNGSGTTVPGSYVADPDSSVAWWTNNVLTYQWVPSGVAFGIILCSNVNDFWSAYDRMIWRQYGAWASYSWIDRGSWILDEDANGVDGELAWATYQPIDNSMQVQAPGQWWQWTRTNLRDSQIAFGCDNRARAAEDHLNYGAPSLVALYGTVSRPDGPGKWLSMTCPQWPYDAANLQYTGIYTDFLGLTCGSTGFDLTSQLSVAADMTKLYYRGADLYIGPTRSIGQGHASYYLDTWQKEWHRDYQPMRGAPFTTMGQLHRVCVDSMKAKFATGEASLIANSIILIGDPTALPPGYWYDVPTSIEGGPAMAASTLSLAVAPNPFNPATSIRYTLATPAPTRLTVYSATGQLVATLVDEYQNAGPHETAWAANERASGVYFCHLASAGQTATQRLILLR